MNRTAPRARITRWILACPVLLAFAATAGADDIDVVLKDGRVLRGGKGYTSGVIEQPRPIGEGGSQRILFVDDEMRRTFVSKRRWESDRLLMQGAPLRPIKIRQPIKRLGRMVGTTGAIQSAEPFNEHGRRTLMMKTAGDSEPVVQGITLLTPAWVKVEGINYVWEARMPTTSLAPEVLANLLNQAKNADSLEYQKAVVARFYAEMDRYEQAVAVLEKLLKKHGDDPKIRKLIEPSLRKFRQFAADRLILELRRRRDNGQHEMVRDGLQRFPAENVAGVVLQEVAELLQEYQQGETQGRQVIEAVKRLVAELPGEQDRAAVAPAAEEIEKELNFNTLGRMIAFRLAANDADMSPAERLAMAVSGWLLGSDAATTNLPNALSAYRVRNIVREYLVEPSEARRSLLLEQLASQEAATPRTVAKLLENMKPPLATKPVEGKHGYYVVEAPGLDNKPIRYLVQTPPEYDPYRVYPTIVTLHPTGSMPERQIEWWAGLWNEKGRRVGQAGRFGYIVIAPQWTSRSQRGYQYSAVEHAAVLDVLRDACRRFSIDTDRVFLSGHGNGGEAAWDLALAHPDHWAGMISVVAKGRRYCHHYWRNAKYVPFYFVGGERDPKWMADNSSEFDRYLKHGFDTTVVEYLGRGHEHYYDEILRIFDWMGRKERNFYPRKFACDSMRAWDNYFWWVEIDDIPAKCIVHPADWPPRGKRAVNTTGQAVPTDDPLTLAKSLRVTSGASRVTVWLSPKMVDFENRVKIVVNRKELDRRGSFLKPDLPTMLEDARARADRRHPFWAKVVFSSGRFRDE